MQEIIMMIAGRCGSSASGFSEKRNVKYKKNFNIFSSLDPFYDTIVTVKI